MSYSIRPDFMEEATDDGFYDDSHSRKGPQR
jgi:hypothetical protein